MTSHKTDTNANAKPYKGKFNFIFSKTMDIKKIISIRIDKIKQFSQLWFQKLSDRVLKFIRETHKVEQKRQPDIVYNTLIIIVIPNDKDDKKKRKQ